VPARKQQKTIIIIIEFQLHHNVHKYDLPGLFLERPLLAPTAKGQDRRVILHQILEAINESIIKETYENSYHLRILRSRAVGHRQ